MVRICYVECMSAIARLPCLVSVSFSSFLLIIFRSRNNFSFIFTYVRNSDDKIFSSLY